MNLTHPSRLLLVASVGLLALGNAFAASSAADLAGVWFPVRFSSDATSAPDEVLQRALPPGATFMPEPGPPIFEYPRGDFGGLRLQPSALSSALQWQPETEPSLATACTPASVLQAMTSPFPLELHPATQLLAIRLEYFDLVRLVHLDGRMHPGPDYPHTRTGHSTARWQGTVLVVDTTHLLPSVITTNGVAHSQNLHVVERFRLDADGSTLHYSQQFDDPEVLQSPGFRYAKFRRQAGNLAAYECDPSYASSIQNRSLR